MGSTEEKQSKQYVIKVVMIHSIYSKHTVTHNLRVISEDIKEDMISITESMNESTFVNIDGTILKCSNIDNITYKEVE